jgi:hypothetical protein
VIRRRLDRGEGGVVAGGGAALLYASKALDGLTPSNPDQKVGIDIVRRALQAPVRQIAKNSGTDGSIIVGKLLKSKDTTYGYDAQKGEFTNMVQAGIIDSDQGGAARVAGRGVGGGPPDHHRGDGRREAETQAGHARDVARVRYGLLRSYQNLQLPDRNSLAGAGGIESSNRLPPAGSAAGRRGAGVTAFKRPGRGAIAPRLHCRRTGLGSHPPGRIKILPAAGHGDVT